MDTETFGLDPAVAGVRQLAFVAEVNGELAGEVQSYMVQPVFHYEDKLYGSQDIQDFCGNYNRKFHAQDPDRLDTFGFKADSPLFFYARSARTFNLTPPQIRNPADWVTAPGLVSAKTAALGLAQYLEAHDSAAKGRWVLAGHNVTFDFNVITFWLKRALGPEAGKVLDKLNSYVFLDTLLLARWFQYSGRLKTHKANLESVASELGACTEGMHEAEEDVAACRQVARRLLNMDKGLGSESWPCYMSKIC
jgi:hypothetical protein